MKKQSQKPHDLRKHNGQPCQPARYPLARMLLSWPAGSVSSSLLVTRTQPVRTWAPCHGPGQNTCCFTEGSDG